MLDKFLEVTYEKSKKAEAGLRLSEAMRKLPNEYLLAIATGQEKLAYSDTEWLDKFKGTPLFEQALEIEKQQLENEMAKNERQRQRDALFEGEDQACEELNIKRKLLDLQLAELEGGGGEQLEAPAEETMGEAPVEEPMAAPAAPVQAVPAQAAPKEKLPTDAQKEVPKEEAPKQASVEDKENKHRWGTLGGGLLGAGTGTVLADKIAPKVPLVGFGSLLLGGSLGMAGAKRVLDKVHKQSPEEKQASVKMASYKLAMARSMQKLMEKEALNPIGAMKGVYQAGKAGWAGSGIARAAASKGFGGAARNVGGYMGNLAKTRPGMAAGLTAGAAAIPAFATGRLTAPDQSR